MAGRRLARNTSRRGDIILYTDLTEVRRDIPLRLDTKRKGFAIRTEYVSAQPSAPNEVAIHAWQWQNGPGGAGTTVENQGSYQAGACEYGEFVWLRRLGVAQPAGQLTELTLPAGIAAYASARWWHGRTYGANNDLYITTLSRYLVKVTNGTGAAGVTEQDFGAAANLLTEGIAIFNGAGDARLYVGCYAQPIQEWNGAIWTAGEAGTERAELETPYWTLGDQLATGGASGDSGSSGSRLVGTNNGETGFYHVAGDPKVAANWSTLTPVGVGGTSYPIMRMIADNRTVFFWTGIGVIAVDGLGRTPNLTQFMELMSTHNRYPPAALWGGLMWMATDEGLSAFNPDGSRVDFGTFLQFGARAGTTPIYGRPRALCPTISGMYVGYYNAETQTSYVGCLLHEDDGSWRWSMAEAVIPGQEVSYLQQVVGSDDVPRLFIGTQAAVGNRLHMYIQDLPISGDPEQDMRSGTSFRAAANWSLTLSRWERDGVPLTFRRWMVSAGQIGSDYPDNTLDFAVSIDDGAFTTQGTDTRDARWSSTPRSGSTSGVSAQIRLTAHNTAASPIVIRNVAANYSLQPEQVEVVTYPVLIAENLRKGDDPGVTLRRLHQAMRDAEPIATTDYYGRAIWTLVESISDATTEEAAGNGWSVHCDVTLSTTRRPALFDVGDTFDSGATFS